VSFDVTPSAAAALDAAAIPAFKVGASRHARLEAAERDLYFWILRQFASSGRPSAAETRQAAEDLGLDAARALQSLATEDLVHTANDGEITVAYPFSGRPTEHRVRFPDGHGVYAMCAIDALGMAPMLDLSVEIVSRDPLTSERIEIALRPEGTGDWQPQGAVVVCGSVRDESCAVAVRLNFFTSSANGQRWLEGRPDVRGYVMAMSDAIEAGRAVFGDLLATAVTAELPASR
jgi:hypothetical protein